MVLAGTGHRPDKLGGYGVDARLRLATFARETLTAYAPDLLISGMAQGWDLALASAAVRLDIPYLAAVPFEGQEAVWPADAQAVYRELLARAASVVCVCEPGYAAWKLQRRNAWMVDGADRIVALWNGSPGGTANCIGYAARAGKPVDNVWERFERTAA